MGICYLMQSGSGSGGLNFKVVGGTTEPNKKENIIWINTDVKIAGWIFSETEPSNRVPGMVWIITGTSSIVEFNALKKNGITVYPSSAKQYVGGAWVDKTAKSWQNGEWVDWWNGELYKNGNQYEFITGGWKAVNASGATATIGKDSISFTYIGNSDRMAAVYTNNKVSVDGKNLYVTVNVTANGQLFTVGLSNQNSAYTLTDIVAQKQTSGTGNMTLEVPLYGVPKGEYYVFAIAYATKAYVTEVKFK